MGFWTKSDSVSYFSNAKIDFTRREPLAASIVRDAFKRYSRLIELTVFIKEPNGFVRALASSKPERVGDGGSTAEREVLEKGVSYLGKTREAVTVTLPLHDRNGDTIASVRVVMKSFVGQTEQNVLARALPVVKQMEKRVRNLTDLVD